MSLININSVQTRTLQTLAKMPPQQGVELLSYKRNRSIAVTVLSGDRYLVRENGYREQERTVSHDDLPRLLKSMIKREFPRSRKVRLCKYSHPDELERPKNII